MNATKAKEDRLIDAYVLARREAVADPNGPESAVKWERMQDAYKSIWLYAGSSQKAMPLVRRANELLAVMNR